MDSWLSVSPSDTNPCYAEVHVQYNNWTEQRQDLMKDKLVIVQAELVAAQGVFRQRDKYLKLSFFLSSSEWKT